MRMVSPLIPKLSQCKILQAGVPPTIYSRWKQVTLQKWNEECRWWSYDWQLKSCYVIKVRTREQGRGCWADAKSMQRNSGWLQCVLKQKKQLIRCFEGGPQFPQSHPDGQSVSQVSGQCQSVGAKWKVCNQRAVAGGGGGLRMYAGQAGPDSCNYPVYTLPSFLTLTLTLTLYYYPVYTLPKPPPLTLELTLTLTRVTTLSTHFLPSFH